MLRTFYNLKAVQPCHTLCTINSTIYSF